MNKELKEALKKHSKSCYCYGCKNNPEKLFLVLSSLISYYDRGE